MKLEATKFRPREVVRHVLQTAAASLQKMLTLEGNIADDIPIEVCNTSIYLVIKQITSNLRKKFMRKIAGHWRCFKD
jgi:replication initiation and membrane attachment protein DnaB